MLWKYISDNFAPGDVIIASDINLGISEENRRQQFKILTDKGLIKRFENGIYYIPKMSRLGNEVSLPPETVIEKKYISRKGELLGYYSGITFANQIGISTQLPFVQEIVTNEIGTPIRKFDIKGRKFIVRKSRTTITKENVKVLQLLDLLKEYDLYSEVRIEEAREIVSEYIKSNKIKKQNFDMYLKLFPDKVYKVIYEMGIGNVFT